MSAFTEGPWEAITRPSDGQIFGRSEAYYVIPASLTEEERDPRCVAEFALFRALSVTQAFDGVAEAKANARLIAAAPDLLAALRLVSDHWKSDYLPQGWEPIAKVVRAAIAKATGQ